MKADLHIHSNYSDGSMSVDEIVNYAQNKGLDVIAITDHDNIESSLVIPNLDKDILVISGVELSTYYNDENIHILGYFYENKITTDEIKDYLHELADNRNKRIYEIIDKLKEIFNVDINYEDIIKFAGGSASRVHIAKAISEKYGMTLDEIFDKYIGNSKKAYVPTTNFDTKDAIDFLHRNNAIAVIAHPIRIKKNDLTDIIKLGVDGIECYYPEHSESDSLKYLELADKYDLLVTGGSDFHGIGIKSDLAISTIDESHIIKLLNKLNIKTIGE